MSFNSLWRNGGGSEYMKGGVTKLSLEEWGWGVNAYRAVVTYLSLTITETFSSFTYHSIYKQTHFRVNFGTKRNYMYKL